jgi:hypothetical protein
MYHNASDTLRQLATISKQLRFRYDIGGNTIPNTSHYILKSPLDGSEVVGNITHMQEHSQYRVYNTAPEV